MIPRQSPQYCGDCEVDFNLISVQIIQDNYPEMVDWPCNVVPWVKTKDLPKKDQNLLFLALSKMDNWESSKSSVKATKWEHFTFCTKNIFQEPEFCHPSAGGNITLNWHHVQPFLVHFPSFSFCYLCA
jgi:hypothetical protein